MSSHSYTISSRSDSLITHHCRAKYALLPDGSRLLLSTEYATRPIFREAGWEDTEKKRSGIQLADEGSECQLDPEAVPIENEKNLARALGRAKVRAFDYLMCNPDLNAFCTFTFAPEAVNRMDYAEVYSVLRPWLSNRVQRRGLKYIIAPEYHHDGESIHLHAICNADALQLTRARSPKGTPLYRKGKPLYNVQDWSFGFSTAQLVEKYDPREAVAKYIFKYMGKQSGAQIGGRYFLHGGALAHPVYEYADELSDLVGECMPAHTVDFEIISGLHYYKHTYL